MYRENVLTQGNNTVMEFDNSMANVRKISEATEDEFKSLMVEAQQLAKTTTYGASEAAHSITKGLVFQNRI